MKTEKKICKKCGLDKSLSEYYKDTRTADNYAYICKECAKEYSNNYRKKNKEKVSKSRSEYYQKNKNEESYVKKKKEYNNGYYKKNAKRICDNAKKYRIENDSYRERALIRSKEHYYNNKEKYQTYFKKYREDDVKRESMLKQQLVCHKKRFKNDINYKMRKRLSSRIRCAIKSQSGVKAYKTIKLLGCTIKEVRKHIESQFTEGMTWDNYGKWHIDHIKPCAAFDLTDPEQQKLCFHWSNMQPMWGSENLSKNSNYDGVRWTYKKREELV